jgi:hypothetical protein
MDVIVVVAIIIPPPATIVLLVVLGHFALHIRALGVVVELVGSPDLAWAMEWALDVREIAPVLTVASLTA